MWGRRKKKNPCGEQWIIRLIFSSVRDDEWLFGRWPINRPELYIIINLQDRAFTVEWWWWVSTGDVGWGVGGWGGILPFNPYFILTVWLCLHCHVLSVNKGIRTVFHFLLFDQHIAQPRGGHPQLQTLRPVDEWRATDGDGLWWLETVVRFFSPPPPTLGLVWELEVEEKWSESSSVPQLNTAKNQLQSSTFKPVKAPMGRYFMWLYHSSNDIYHTYMHR